MPIPEQIAAFAAGMMTLAPGVVSQDRPGGMRAAVADAMKHMGLGAFDPDELAEAAHAWVNTSTLWRPAVASPPASPPPARTWAPCGDCGCGALSHAGGAAGACLTVGCGCKRFA
jgi:hypothetical protein